MTEPEYKAQQLKLEALNKLKELLIKDGTVPYDLITTLEEIRDYILNKDTRG